MMPEKFVAFVTFTTICNALQKLYDHILIAPAVSGLVIQLNSQA